jgi:hypothetical protein
VGAAELAIGFYVELYITNITGNFSINGISMQTGPSLTVLNGTRMIPVTKVLLPPSR